MVKKYKRSGDVAGYQRDEEGGANLSFMEARRAPYENAPGTFPEWLDRAMEDFSLDEEELANRISGGVSANDINDLRIGIATPGESLKQRLAHVFELGDSHQNYLASLSTPAIPGLEVQRAIDIDEAVVKAPFDRSHLEIPKISDEQYQKMFQAREAFYTALSQATDGRIDTPQKLHEATGLHHAVCEGYKHATRRNLRELQAIEGVSEAHMTALVKAAGAFIASAVIQTKQPNEIGLVVLRRDYEGDNKKINDQLCALRDSLIEAKQKEGMSPEKAEQWVDQHWVGWRKSKNGKNALYLTDEGKTLWINTYEPKPRTESYPAPKPGEMSATMLRRDYEGDNRKINDQLRALRTKQIKMKQVEGMSPEEAEQWVDQNIVGWRKPKRGQNALYLTPAGKELWLQEYRQRPQQQENERPYQGTLSQTDVADRLCEYTPGLSHENALIITRRFILPEKKLRGQTGGQSAGALFATRTMQEMASDGLSRPCRYS